MIERLITPETLRIRREVLEEFTKEAQLRTLRELDITEITAQITAYNELGHSCLEVKNLSSSAKDYLIANGFELNFYAPDEYTIYW